MLGEVGLAAASSQASKHPKPPGHDYLLVRPSDNRALASGARSSKSGSVDWAADGGVGALGRGLRIYLSPKSKDTSVGALGPMESLAEAASGGLSFSRRRLTTWPVPCWRLTGAKEHGVRSFIGRTDGPLSRQDLARPEDPGHRIIWSRRHVIFSQPALDCRIRSV